MTLSTFITQAAEEVDFSYTVSGYWMPSTLWIFILASTCIVFSILAAFYYEEISAFFIFLVISVLVTFLALVIIAGSVGRSTTYDTEAFQKWSKDNYLLEFNDEQSKDLMRSQIDLSDTDTQSSSSVFVKNAYGKIVAVTLVKDGDNWTLFQQESMSPEALGEK